MKEKESYTLEELCNGLKMPMSKFCQMAGITEGTIARLRKGYSARRGTVNTLLDTFSQVYGIDFTLENVSGLTPIEKTITPISEVPQKRTTVERKGKTEFPIPNDLPLGTVKLIDFAKKYGVPESSMSRYVDPKAGIKSGEWIATTTRSKPSGMGVQHYLSPDQQEKALEILRRHGKLKTSEPEEKPPGAEGPIWYLPDKEDL